MLDLNKLLSLREDNRLEAKQALGGLPESIWETYSAFANAEGGFILLGVEELPDKSLQPVDLLDPHWLIDDFITLLNNPEKVSANILSPEDIQIHQIQGKQIISIHVPKADASHFPVYIDNDPIRGAYRRCGEGDYRLEPEQIPTLMAERSHEDVL